MVPLANMFGYVNNLRSMSQGRASYTMQFDHYEQVPPQVAQEGFAEIRLNHRPPPEGTGALTDGQREV